jgi:hypothetical protein
MDGIVGGPGWLIDGETLLPRIVDVDEFRRGLADDPLRDAVEALWSGRPDDAAAILRRHRPTLRVRALLADCSRDQGHPDRAVRAYRRLVDECVGTPGEPVMRQHLGKALFAGEHFEEAAEQFALALALREEAGAEEALLTSSRFALQVARRSIPDT